MKWVWLLLLLTACGSDGGGDSSESCSEKTEIATMATEMKTYAALAESTVNLTVTLKDQCPNVQYSGIYTIKEASEPANCTDGDSTVTSAAGKYWTGLKPSTAYFIRACVTNSAAGYTSAGVTKAVTTPAE